MTGWRRQQQFGAILERVRCGPIPCAAADHLPFGTAWNTAANNDGRILHATWMLGQMNGGLATCLEIPYAHVKARAVSPDDGRMLGRDLAQAIRQYLQSQ